MANIKQISIIYNQAPYIIIDYENVQGYVGNLSEQVLLPELNLYYTRFAAEIAISMPGYFLDFSKGTYVLNGQPNNAIIVLPSPTPPPVDPFVTREIRITNDRTVGDQGVSFLSNDYGISNNNTNEGGHTQNIVFGAIDPIRMVLFTTQTSDPEGTFDKISTNAVVNFKKSGVVLQSVPITPISAIEVFQPVLSQFDEIQITDTGVVPPTTTGVFTVSPGAGTDIVVTNITGITNDIAYPVNHGVSESGNWTNFAGGNIAVSFTSGLLVGIQVRYNGALVGSLSNLPGSGTYVVTGLPVPANAVGITVILTGS